MVGRRGVYKLSPYFSSLLNTEKKHTSIFCFYEWESYKILKFNVVLFYVYA